MEEKEKPRITDQVKKKMSCFDGISINRPLMENVFILLHSFICGIPVYISGRPGTSKSVSIQIVEAIFNFDEKLKKESNYFKNLKTAKFYPLWGSKNTTARHVQEAFNQVKEIAKLLETTRF